MTFSGFSTRYGRGLVASLASRFDRYLVVAQPEHWERLRPWASGPGGVGHPALAVPPVELSQSNLDSLARIAPEADMVIGIGGSAAIDTAKWLQHCRSIPMYLVPSLPSVKACFTREIRLRDHRGQPFTQGGSAPEEVLIDYDLMWSAPPVLVRAGIGDVLACHTACFDWRLASDAGQGPPFDPAVADRARLWVEELDGLGPALADGRDEGLRRLMECRRAIGWQRDALGHSSFEVGREHAFAAAVEEVTGRAMNHGELVALGAILVATLQGNRPEVVRRIVAGARVRADPASLGLSWSEVVAALRRLSERASAAPELDLGTLALARARRAVEPA